MAKEINNGFGKEKNIIGILFMKIKKIRRRGR